MLHIQEEDLKVLLRAELVKGINLGIRHMEDKMLLSCNDGNAIDIDGRAYFVQSDIQHMRQIVNISTIQNRKKNR